MNKDHAHTATLEELEGVVWPEPPTDSTGLVKAIHRLRRVPIGELTAYELGRLIGQDVGLTWTLPLAIHILRETAPAQNDGGFYDDDLLSAALTRDPETWLAHPELARELRDILRVLTDLSPYIEHDKARFLQASQGVV
ncbi:contact-dependent growth inhibition system immunity protein [Streptomyces sp. NPDC054987]